MNNEKQNFSADNCAAILAFGIFLFLLMPIIGTVWILVKGWDNTPDYIKRIWILSIVVIGGFLIISGGKIILEKWHQHRLVKIYEKIDIEIVDIKLGNTPKIKLNVTSNDRRDHTICISGGMWVRVKKSNSSNQVKTDQWWIAHEEECQIYEPNSKLMTTIGPFYNIMVGGFGPSSSDPNYDPEQICVYVWSIDEDNMFLPKWRKNSSLPCSDDALK